MRAPGIALLSGCAFVAIMLLVMYWHPLAAIDQIVSSHVMVLRSDMADNAMFLLTSMADARVLIITDVAIVALLIAARHRRLALASASVFIGCALSVQLIKLFVQRARPTPTLYEGISAFRFSQRPRGQLCRNDCRIALADDVSAA
ncbi:MAG: hypothetical protein R3F24_13755 [Gammaproteobacteria bacterium]